MDIKHIMDSIYIIPVLLDHLDNPRENTKAFLDEQGITPENIAEAGQVRKLLEYHHHYVTKRLGNYPLLREGLSQYFDAYLSTIFQRLGLVDKHASVLDLGCGEGQYARQFMLDNPDSIVKGVDRELKKPANFKYRNMFYQSIDFDHNLDWFIPFKESYDLIIMSELLHCKNSIGQQQLIMAALHMLAPGGILLINENLDHAMEYRISDLKGYNHPIITPARVRVLTHTVPATFELLTQLTINSHIFYVLEKI